MTQEEFYLAANKGNNIFLTGIAGSGKTYAIEQWKQANMTKNIITVAPTGIAAINCGGATIHSTFKLGWGNDYSRIRPQLVMWSEVDILIIDEISMVSCDMLDFIDRILKYSRNSTKPFGGMQIILIGDLKQLPPIFNMNEEKDRKRYEELNGNVYFNNSSAYKKGVFKEINLSKNYRSEDKLLSLLNKIRDGDLSVVRDFKRGDLKNAVHLMPYNTQVDNYNEYKLSQTPGKKHTFIGKLKGDFNLNNCLTPMELNLKVGAKVMFTVNEAPLINGDTGIIEYIEGNTIGFYSERLDTVIDVIPYKFRNIGYDENGKEKELGSFKQYPLRLGWALTIHKSQGLTLKKLVFHYNTKLSKELIYTALSRGVLYNNITIKGI